MKLTYINKIIILLIGLTLFMEVSGQIYNYNVEPKEGETFTNALFRIYIPENTDTIKGVFHYVYWLDADSRSKTSDLKFRFLCNQLGFALLGSRLDSRHMKGGIGDALLNSLDTFSVWSNHPELKFAPIFFNGRSWGGQWAYDFALWKPERVIGLITHKGGYHTTGDAGKATNVPCYMLIGENDRDYRITNLSGIFDENRPKGAPWAIAIEPDAGHGPVTDTSLLFPYIMEIVKLRLPKQIKTDTNVVLNTIDLSKGWYGNRSSFYIGKENCLLNDTKINAWLPNRTTAIKWQDFVTAGKYNNNKFNAFVCYGDSLIWGNKSYNTPGIYYDTINECDSLFKINISIVKLDNSVTQNNNNLIANDTIGKFRWLDCENNYKSISGKINNVFTPDVSGNYSVELSYQGCKDTSSCYYISVTNVTSKMSKNTCNVYFSAANKKLYIKKEANSNTLNYQLLDISGNILQRGRLNTESIDVSNLNKGMYIFSLISNDWAISKKIVIE